MLQAPIPPNDAARLQELRSYGVLDSPDEQAFDDIGALVRDIAATPIGIISLVDENRQWFKSCIGLDAKETPRNISFCGHTILQRTPLIINDSLEDPRFCDNPLVIQEPHIRFYAGFPLISSNGLALGSLCAVDQQPRQLNDSQIQALERLARLAVRQMELKRQGQLLVQATQPATPEALSPAPPARLHQLLTSKEQLISMVELMLSQSSQACFGLMRLEFKELRRIANALGEASANALRSEQLERLAALLPDNASCCELNEQEWLMLTPFTATEEQLCSQAAAITEQLQQPIGVAQQLLSSQVAVGAALVQGNYSNAHDLLSDAAIALRNAARRPGSHYSCIDLASRIQAQQDLQLESELRAGLSQGQLEPHFQPLFDLKTREVMGVEALARWRRSDGELLLPSLFLEAAERAELLGELDLQMIRQAIAASHVMARVQPQRPMLLSLNLSGALLESPALLQNLFALIDAEPLPQNWQLQLEMLEVNLQQPEAEIARTLQHLHQRGVFLAIDDFGTGYSSLSRLNRFPFHSLKVDMSFVKLLDAPEQPSNRILEVIQAMADALELHTTAEGVETEAQRQWLQRQGFHWGQGYLLAKPMPLQEILNLLLTQQVQAVPL
ncbi:MAG: sensor domain-containing phosphodiesterase [Cyanobacteria bacterium K_DeepCast_150m_m2_101]|nr:sensor domain-containing phosphodiesterase [Cyanobacteria bacterium K_DeepCast_150m_m2_101]